MVTVSRVGVPVLRASGQLALSNHSRWSVRETGVVCVDGDYPKINQPMYVEYGTTVCI